LIVDRKKYLGLPFFCFVAVGGVVGLVLLCPEKEGTGETGDVETKFGLGDDILSQLGSISQQMTQDATGIVETIGE
jgi:hypothetical protein